MPGFMLAFMAVLAVSPAAAPDTIPFEFVRNQIVLQVPFDSGDTLTMLLDTGVNPSAIDQEFARRTGALVSEEPIGFAGGAGSGDRRPIYRASIHGARLGSVQLNGLDAVAVDMTPIGAKIGRPLHGILGYCFFTGRRVRIDYPGRRVILEPRAAPAGRALFRDSLVFVPGDIMPLLHLDVNGARVPVSLDTGSSLVLELFPKGSTKAGVVADSGRTTQLRGAAGTFEARTARADSIAIGRAAMRDGEVLLSAHRGPEARWGNLGNGFLGAFVLTLDYAARTISLHEASPRSR